MPGGITVSDPTPMGRDGRMLLPLLRRPDLPPAFERWRLDLEPGTERPTRADEWAGALVLVERGVLEVDCDGGRRMFHAGDLLALGWLPLRTLRSQGQETVRLLAVRRTLPRTRASMHR